MAVNNDWKDGIKFKQPKTYIDQKVDGGDQYRLPPFYQQSHSNDPRDLSQMAKWAIERIAPIVQETIEKRQAIIVYRREHINALWDSRPKELDYVVLKKFTPIDFNGARYRFDNIYYNERSFIRIVMDDKATEQLIQEIHQDRYSGLVEGQESNLVKEVVDALMSQSEDQTARILNAIALLKKKPVPGEEKEEQLKVPAQEKKIDQPFLPTDNFVSPVAFYENEHFLGLMSREYMVHKHPKLGFLIAL